MSYTARNLTAGDRELIAFRIGDQEFCVNIMSVREIRGWTPATAMPHSPAYVLGVINLSLGEKATQSASSDPWCQAVQRAIAWAEAVPGLRYSLCPPLEA